jgi:hypothetical protein
MLRRNSMLRRTLFCESHAQSVTKLTQLLQLLLIGKTGWCRRHVLIFTDSFV